MNDGAKFLVLQSPAGEDGEIVTGGVMVFTVQSVGGFKGSVITAVGPGFVSHCLAKAFHRTADMLCDGNRHIIVGFQHEGIEQIGQEKLISFLSAEMNFRSGGRILGKGYRIRQFTMF